MTEYLKVPINLTFGDGTDPHSHDDHHREHEHDHHREHEHDHHHEHDDHHHDQDDHHD